MPGLPPPATTDQEYLAAVLDQLRTLNDHFGGGRAEPDDGTVAISEPDRPSQTVEVVDRGGGWYDVTVDGESVDTVRGQDAAEAAAEELRSGND